MLGSLIKRKGPRPFGHDNIAFESTLFTLSTEVPRPVERRLDERVMPMLRVAKVSTADHREVLVRVRNLSAGGMMAELSQQLEIGEDCEVEINSQLIPSSVVWTREGTAGFKFDRNIDLGEMLAGRKPRHGYRPRPPRLRVDCKANLKVGSTYYSVGVNDISLGGIKVEPVDEYCLGEKVVIVVESLKPIKGEVRWYSDRKAGIVFDKPLEFNELAEWMGKRLEMASLKAQANR